MSKWVARLLIGLAFVMQMLVVIPSGSRYCNTNGSCGDYYWGAHEHDGIWHLALAKTAFQKWPPQMPTYAKENLTGYNWLLDYPIYILSKVGIDAKISYFKIFPLIWFGLMIWSWSKFAKAYNQEERYFSWLILLLFFGNSFSFIFSLLNNGNWDGGSGLLAMQSPQMLTNIQFAYTIPLIALTGVVLLRAKNRKWDDLILATLIFIGMGLKFYGGSILLAWVIIHSLLNKNWIRVGYSVVGFVAATLLFYQPSAGSSSAIFAFKPLATVFPIVEEKALFYLAKIAEMRYAVGEWAWIKEIFAGLVALVVFAVFNFGIRLVGISEIKRANLFEKSIFLTIAVAVGANVLLVQRGEWWNTVQFLYYAFILLSILAAKYLTKIRSILLTVIIALLLMPNAVDTVRIFGSRNPSTVIYDSEIEILHTLEKQPDGVVLALPLKESAYVSAYSGKVVYLSDKVQARLVGIDYIEREALISGLDCRIMSDVSYVYLSGDKGQIDNWLRCPKVFDRIAGNEMAELYRVR